MPTTKLFFRRALALALALAALTAGPVLAEAQSVQAWIADQVKINLNGSELRMPNGKNVLNYDGQLYLPMRFIAEIVGGTVRYDADYARVYIYTPQPRVEYVEIPVETVVEALPERVYVKAPGKRRIAGVTLNVYGLSTPSDYTDLYFDIKNENGRYIELDLENAYLEYKGIRYKSLPQLVDRSLRGSVAVDADLVGQVLTFEALPKTAQDVTVLIPVKTREWSAEQNEVADFVYNFNMDIDFTY